MTQEQFGRITGNCQPHNVFSSDWTQYLSDDFADSLLPDARLQTVYWDCTDMMDILTKTERMTVRVVAKDREGSGKSLKFPYEFFMSEKRVEDFDVKNLREYFKGVRYLSFENLGYSPSNPDGENIFLYNDTSKLPVILESLKLFHENLSKREDCGPVGGNERFKTERSETESFVNENLFLSYSIGYEDGDFDDIGAALGKYAMRCYYQGWLDKNYQLGQWVLKVESVKCRFFDDFNFDDDKKVWWKPLTWFSQMLGYWDSDTNDPKEPFYFGIKIRQNLNNKKFRQLRNVLQVSLNNCCNDFYIFSNIKTIDDEFVKKSIIILGEY